MADGELDVLPGCQFLGNTASFGGGEKPCNRCDTELSSCLQRSP